MLLNTHNWEKHSWEAHAVAQLRLATATANNIYPSIYDNVYILVFAGNMASNCNTYCYF